MHNNCPITKLYSQLVPSLKTHPAARLRPERTCVFQKLRHVLAQLARSKMVFFGKRKFRSEEHTSELQSRRELVCRLLLETKKNSCVRNVINQQPTLKDVNG